MNAKAARGQVNGAREFDGVRNGVAGVSDCRAITERHEDALPSPDFTLPGDSASDPATSPARHQARECQGLKLVIVSSTGAGSVTRRLGVRRPTLSVPVLRVIVGGRHASTK